MEIRQLFAVCDGALGMRTEDGEEFIKLPMFDTFSQFDGYEIKLANIRALHRAGAAISRSDQPFACGCPVVIVARGDSSREEIENDGSYAAWIDANADPDHPLVKLYMSIIDYACLDDAEASRIQHNIIERDFPDYLESLVKSYRDEIGDDTADVFLENIDEASRRALGRAYPLVAENTAVRNLGHGAYCVFNVALDQIIIDDIREGATLCDIVKEISSSADDDELPPPPPVIFLK